MKKLKKLQNSVKRKLEECFNEALKESTLDTSATSDNTINLKYKILISKLKEKCK